MRQIRRRKPFWNRTRPISIHDIAKLRPETLPLGKRFETVKDALSYNIESAQRLSKSHPILAKRLNSCGPTTDLCQQTYCHLCLRQFRIWFIEQLLRLTRHQNEPIHISTVLLEQADRKEKWQTKPSRS